MVACAKWLGREIKTCTRGDTGCVCRREEMQNLTFEDALRIARGCKDYAGGHGGNAEHYEIYQHGIGTVINALEGAAKNGLKDTQVAALHAMGANK